MPLPSQAFPFQLFIVLLQPLAIPFELLLRFQ
jgi:hypothetical protein